MQVRNVYMVRAVETMSDGRVAVISGRTNQEKLTVEGSSGCVRCRSTVMYREVSKGAEDRLWVAFWMGPGLETRYLLARTTSDRDLIAYSVTNLHVHIPVRTRRLLYLGSNFKVDLGQVDDPVARILIDDETPLVVCSEGKALVGIPYWDDLEARIAVVNTRTQNVSSFKDWEHRSLVLGRFSGALRGPVYRTPTGRAVTSTLTIEDGEILFEHDPWQRVADVRGRLVVFLPVAGSQITVARWSPPTDRNQGLRARVEWEGARSYDFLKLTARISLRGAHIAADFGSALVWSARQLLRFDLDL